MNQTQYIIASLPRCRTAWVANWLTAGPSWCYHDPALEVRELGNLLDLLRSTRKPFVGLCDTGVATYWRILFEALPHARLIVLHRPWEEVKDSWLRWAKDYPAMVGPKFMDRLARMREEFEAMDTLTRDRERMDVEVKDLDRLETCRDLWEFVAPGHPLDEPRCVSLLERKVEVMLPKLVRHPQMVAAIKELEGH